MIASTLTRYQGPEAEPILDCVRLQLIGMKDLLNEVRPLKLASADSIMDAISMKVEFYKKSCRIKEFWPLCQFSINQENLGGIP